MSFASPKAISRVEIDTYTIHRETDDVEASANRSLARISVDFLLNFTDPSGYRPAAAISAEATDLNAAEYDVDSQIPSIHSEDALALHDQPFEDIDDFLSGYCFPLSVPGEKGERMSTGTINSIASDTELMFALEARAGEMVTQLVAQQLSLQERDGGVENNLDVSLANVVFTAANVRQFVWAFFHYFHSQFPILHRATFDVRTVSMPLLLAVVLFGSMSFYPSDNFLAMRQFFAVAESYIFDQSLFRKMPQCSREAWGINDEIELLQAGLLIVMMQNNNTDLITRRRIRVQRIPSLISTIRASGLFSYRRHHLFTSTSSPAWQLFVADEARVR
ncbi:hypothetical protein HJFPF1_07196 [Paramyrothecium foliicola]|nr:hypothetical protein HJFPF1_07196 [Paramyrothecium foliicola]